MPTNDEIIQRLRNEIKRLENLPSPESRIIAASRRNSIKDLETQLAELENN